LNTHQNISDAYLQAYITGALGRDESRALESLFSADHTLEKRIATLRVIYNMTEETATATTWNTNAAWQKMSQSLEKGSELPKHTVQRSISWLRVAASVAILVSVSWIAYQFMTNPGHHTMTASVTNEKIDLPDGSEVFLTEGSTLSYDRTGRNVTLKGQAYFDVARDESRPFIISMNHGSIEVLGTAFEVKESDSDTRLTVTEGKVKYASNSASDIVRVGEAAILRHTTGAIDELTYDDSVLRWHTNTWTVEDIALQDLMVQIGDTYNTDIAISDQDMLSCTFTTIGTEVDLQGWLELLSKTFTFQITRSPDGYILNGGSCAIPE